MSASLGTLNRLLRTASPEGAFSLGMIWGRAQNDNIVTPDVVLEAAVLCKTVAEAEDLYETCCAKLRPPQ